MRSLLRPSSLIFKVILVTSLILIIAISLSVWLHIRLDESSIRRRAYDNTKIVSECIERNVIRVMERGKHFDIDRVLKSFTSYRGIYKINLIRPDGVIRASTHNDEVNKNVGDVEFFLKKPYLIREEVVRRTDGREGKERIYYLNKAILNKPECFQCHSSEKEIVGILTVANYLGDMDSEILKLKKTSIVLAIVTIAVLSGVLGFLFMKFINNPITKLVNTMRKVEKGDLNARADIESQDEMGHLAENLNTMIGKLNAAKKEAEEYHQELIRRADRMASIGELASGIAHEVRNPLAGIQGAVQILADGFPRDDSRRQVSNEIQKQINKMEMLVKDLLNYAKPVPTNYLPTDINELIDRVLAFSVYQPGKSEGFKVKKDFFSPLPKTMIDPNSMEQAFLNIILNAQKAMPRGGTFAVSTRSLNHKQDGDEIKEVQIIFEDTGTGISKGNLPKIFNPFFSTRSDGTGLGLSITKNIVEQHGGRIEVESQVNVGTKFIITLPVMKAQSKIIKTA